MSIADSVTEPVETPATAVDHHDVVVVGAGFSGLGASIALADAGIDHVLLERAADVGGTWRDNHYPGCRCDVPSHLYSFSFAPNPDWTQTYSPQPEIQAYLRRTAEQRGVVDRIRFGHDVREMAWDDATARWRIDTSAGPLTASVLVMGQGLLAEPAWPVVAGIETFAGPSFHSARWPEIDLAGQRVGVVGTGASAVQIVPAIQPEVAHLSLFQRTPPWVVPGRNKAIPAWQRSLYRRVPATQQAVRAAIYWSRELLAQQLVKDGAGLQRIAKMARQHLAEQVPDPELRARLTPAYTPGCKRLTPSNDYLPAVSQPNVELVTEGITEVRPDGIVTADGTLHELDAIVWCTGFQAAENPVARRVRGRDGRTLAEHWAPTGARAHLGATVPGFPNLFLVAGPNTGIGHTSLVVMIEAQIRYLVDALGTMRARGASTVDVRPAVFDDWCREIDRKTAGTVWHRGGCASWYLDSQGRNTTLWPDETYKFRRRTRRFDARNYAVTVNGSPALGAASADEVSLRIAAPADQLYALVSDVAGMGRLSPECTGGRWLGGVTGPAVGARFKGTNRRGRARWSTTNTVVAADPGRRFAFDTKQSGVRWSYRFEPDGDATIVTETRERVAPYPLVARVFTRFLLGGIDEHADELRAGMRSSLRRLEAVATGRP